MGFFDEIFIEKPIKKEQIIVIKPQKTDIIIEFVMKDKFQLLEQGYDKFYFVDDKLITYKIANAYSNIYTWRTAKIGDRIRQTTLCDKMNNYYHDVLKYEIIESVNA
jgi:hypothetical protein